MTSNKPSTQVGQEAFLVLPSWLRISSFSPLLLVIMVLSPLLLISIAIITKYPGSICFTAPGGWQIKIVGSEMTDCPLPKNQK
jgi:hypothetical protein